MKSTLIVNLTVQNEFVGFQALGMVQLVVWVVYVAKLEALPSIGRWSD
jgi:hypothetical protein